MFLLRLLLTLNCIITLIASGANGYGPLSGYARAGAQQGAMGTYGLDPKLASILDKYYKNNFTSEQEWEALNSIRIEGVLHLSESEHRFKVYKKKPYSCKTVLFGSNEGMIEMGYDGEDAWKNRIIEDETSLSAMLEEEASNFKRDATIGGHLLYPLIKGKEVELLGTVLVDDFPCYEILITLPDGQIIRSFLDVKDYTQRRLILVNQVSADEEVITDSDFRKISGMTIPFSSTITVGGVLVCHYSLAEIKVNYGAMDWMFARPSSASANLLVSPLIKMPKNSTTSDEPETKKPLNSTFGSYFGVGSAFDINVQGYQAGQVDNILRDAGIPKPAKKQPSDPNN